MEKENKTQQETKPVTIHLNKNGEPDGVLVQTIDESFIVSLHDAENGREMTWKEAVDNYGDTSLPNKNEAAIICAYLDEINAALKEAGGDPLDRWYWTGTEYNANIAWFYYGSYGCLNGSIKYNTYSVRPTLASAFGPF